MFNKDQKLKLVKAIIALAFVAGILRSPHLWLNEGRFFPVIQLSYRISILPYPFDFLLLIFFIGFCFTWVFYAKKWIGIATLTSLLIILIQDQMRWQPWVYLYMLMLLPSLYQSHKEENERVILICLQLIVAGVYVWSGIQKLNSNFIDDTVSLIIKVSGIELANPNWKKLGYAIPCIEIFIGLALLIPKLRKIGIYGAASMHILVLFYLSPIVLHHNSVVYPWNVAMIIFVFLLFKNDDESFINSIHELRKHFLLFGTVALVWIFPVLNFFGCWDHYLSFSLYSGKPSRFYIAVEKTELQKIDKRLENYFVQIPGMQGGQLIDVDKWAFSELNVPFYPEVRSFKRLSGNFCELGIDGDKLIFLELYHSNAKTEYKTFTCGQLK